MSLLTVEFCLRQATSVLYIAVDGVIHDHGRSNAGFEEFTAAIDHQSIPAVWLTRRSRLQFDDARRQLGHTHPFIAEDGCAVYLPEDYFHLRPESDASRRKVKTSTLRFGRFTCVPIGEPLPAASQALETLAGETGVPVVTLRSLSPRELVRNTGLSKRQAELMRQRDFDELFFFAGASNDDIERFLAEGRKSQLQFRQHGVLWSAALGASVQGCIRELSKLYDRALHYHAHTVGIATPDFAPEIFANTERSILLTDRQFEDTHSGQLGNAKARRFALHAESWQSLIESIAATAN
jgi:predicted mannosyl-3-phosphoglycerate phosphatase (HAD superfamily)